MATDTATREFSAGTKDLGDKIVALTLKQAKELSDYLEEVHGIKPAAGGAVMMAVPAAAVAAPPLPAEKTEFDVILEGFGDKKIGVIKVVRVAHGPGPEGSQGSGRRRSQQGQGRHLQGRCREGQEGAGRSRRTGFDQVASRLVASIVLARPSWRRPIARWHVAGAADGAGRALRSLDASASCPSADRSAAATRRLTRSAMRGCAWCVRLDSTAVRGFSHRLVSFQPRSNPMATSAERRLRPKEVRRFGSQRAPHHDSRSDRDPDPQLRALPAVRRCRRNKRTDQGIEGVLREIFPIESYDKTLRLEYLRYELGKPRYEPHECRQLRLTYGRPFRVWLRLTKEQPIEEEVYLGDMPIMLGGGEFIINGAERVVVSQLHRSPGVDFVSEIEGRRPPHATVAASFPSAAVGSSSTPARRTRSASASTRAASSRP